MTQTHHDQAAAAGQGGQPPVQPADGPSQQGENQVQRQPQPQHETQPVWFGAPRPMAGASHPGDHPAHPMSPQPPAGPPPSAPTRDGAEHAQPANRRRLTEMTAVALLAALLASGGTYAATQLDSQETQSSSAANSSSSLGRGTDTGPVQQADPMNPNWTATSAAVAPSVVSITLSAGRQSGQGSGVVIDDKGHILTNNHVVSGAGNGELTVTLHDGRTYQATIAGTDPSTDLAVITLADPPEDLTPIAFGDSEALKGGDPVWAIGNPLGLAGRVTTGIVSALNGPVTTSGEDSGGSDPFGQQPAAEPVVTNAIQTSAAINPGNSGGALVNGSGQLVGINSSIATLGSGGQSGSIGIGFAIPVNEAKAIATQLIEKGKAEHAFLGVTPRDGAASDGSSQRAGAEIASVSPGTPAAAAGLREGDVVVAVDGDRVDSALSLVASIRERMVGDKVTLTVLRDGKEQELTATLAAKATGQQ